MTPETISTEHLAEFTDKFGFGEKVNCALAKLIGE